MASDGAARSALQELVNEIIQLGQMPTPSKNASIQEKRLATRLSKACKEGLLTTEQEAAFDKLAQASGASQPAVASGGAGQTAQQKLVNEIIKLGHMPTQSKNASVEENRLAVEQGTQGGLVDKGAGGNFGQASATKKYRKVGG